MKAGTTLVSTVVCLVLCTCLLYTRHSVNNGWTNGWLDRWIELVNFISFTLTPASILFLQERGIVIACLYVSLGSL